MYNLAGNVDCLSSLSIFVGIFCKAFFSVCVFILFSKYFSFSLSSLYTKYITFLCLSLSLGTHSKLNLLVHLIRVKTNPFALGREREFWALSDSSTVKNKLFLREMTFEFLPLSLSLLNPILLLLLSAFWPLHYIEIYSNPAAPLKMREREERETKLYHDTPSPVYKIVYVCVYVCVNV